MTLPPRSGIGCVALAFLAILSVKLSAQTAPVAAHADTSSRPNVVLFLVDDQGWGDMGYHGNPYAKTPNMDAFAKEAVELTRFYVSPVCSPTRASLMTGRYNFRTGVTSVFNTACNMDPAETTIAQVLRKSGYATGIFGKWHLGDEGPLAPGARGFDESLTFRGAAMSKYFDPELLHNGAKQSYHGYCMDIFTSAAVDFIRKNRSRPFFVYLPANLIHTPVQVSEELAEPYVASGLPGKLARLCGMLTSVDNSFARVIDVLRELKLEDNTLIILTSDNGPCSGSMSEKRFIAGLHGLKGTVYENGIRVPCFMRWPARFSAHAKVNRLAAHLDVMPTILDACGVDLPAGVKLDGVSLLPLLRDPGANWPDRTIFFQWDGRPEPRRGRAYCVLTDRWKLVQPVGMDRENQQTVRDWYRRLCKEAGRGDRSIEGDFRYELYDVAVDPGEYRDLAAEHPDIVEKMKKQYDAWFTDVCARWLDKQ